MSNLKYRETEKSANDVKKMEINSYGDPPVEEEKVGLKRQVGLLSGIALIVGSMIGSGIFVSPKGVLINTESVGMSLVIWTLCGLLATLGALCYAELGTMIPKSGGEHAYLNEVYGQPIAFLFAWTAIIVLKPSALAIISLSFGEYVVQPFYEGSECGPPTSATKIVAVLCVILIVVINCSSVKAATGVQNFFTVAKLLACALIVIVGFVEMGKGNTQYINPTESFKGSTGNVFAYGLAFYQGLWAYDGWNQLNYITEELVNPYRNLPLAIIIGIPLVTTVYLFVNMAYFTVMSPDELLQSGAVAVTFANRTLGVMAWIMPVAVAFSTFGAANGMTFAASRLTFVAAREGHMVKILSMVHAERITPFTAVIFTAIVAVLMMIPSDFDTLVNYFSFAAWMFYGATALGLIILRYKQPDAHRPIKVPIVIPVIVVITSVYLVVAPIIDQPTLEFLYAALFILAGFILYFPFVHYGYHPIFMNYITTFFQLLFEVVPGGQTSDEDSEESKEKVVMS